MQKLYFFFILLLFPQIGLHAQTVFYENESIATANNSLQTATYVDIQYTQISGNIDYHGDVDYYKILVPAGKTVELKFQNITRRKMQPAGFVFNQQDLSECEASSVTTYVKQILVTLPPSEIVYYKLNLAKLNDCLSAVYNLPLTWIIYDLALVSLYLEDGTTVLFSDNYQGYTINNRGSQDQNYYLCLANPIDGKILGGIYTIFINRL